MGCGFTLLMMGFVTIPALAIFYKNFDLLWGIYTIPFHSFFNFWNGQVREIFIDTTGKIAVKCISKIGKFDCNMSEVSKDILLRKVAKIYGCLYG